MPIISVVIPAYNAENTILETIASVRQQTFSELD
jgi:glycosyltransferase involved in cell wall biosynthesis